jgi:hypothetical protein
MRFPGGHVVVAFSTHPPVAADPLEPDVDAPPLRAHMPDDRAGGVDLRSPVMSFRDEGAEL